MRASVLVVAAAVSGALLWAASPALGVGPLAWVALLPVAAASARAAGTRLGRLAGPLAYGVYLELVLVPAFPFGLTHDQWGRPALPILVGDSPALAIALVGVPLVALCLYALRFPTLGTDSVLVAAAAWTALDLVRVKLDPSGLWGPLFLTQADLPTASLASVGGPWLLTFCLVAFQYAVVVPRARIYAAVVAVAMVAAMFTLPRLGGEGNAIRVAAVQPGYDTAEWDQAPARFFRPEIREYVKAARDVIGDLAPLTRVAARRGARIVVWPEAALWVDPRSTRAARRALIDLARETHATLVVPYFIRADAQGAAVVVHPHGGISAPHPKQRTMWFLGESGGNRTPPAPVRAAGVSVGTLLGIDPQDPVWPRQLVSGGAELLTSSTHDWKELAPQQRAYLRLHARALGTPIVRADWRFGSAIVAADGDLAAGAGTGRKRTVIVARVAARGGRAPYETVGDLVGWLSLAAAVAAAVGSRLTGRFTRPATAGSPARGPG